MADNPLLDLYGSQQASDHPLLNLYGPQEQQPQVDLGDQPNPKQPLPSTWEGQPRPHGVPQITIAPPPTGDQPYDVAGGPGSGKVGGDAIMRYESIYDKPKPPKPLQAAPPGFKLDDQGNYSRTKEGQNIQPVDIAGDIEKARQQAVDIGAQVTGVSSLRDLYTGTPWTEVAAGMVPGMMGQPEERGIAEGAKAVKNILSPTSSDLGREASLALRKATGTAARTTEQTRAELLPYQQQIALLQPQQRFDLLGYMEGRSKGATLPDPALQGYADQFRKEMNLRKEMIANAGIQAGVIEDYVTHFWKDPSSARAFINSWAKQGSGASLKERTLPTIAEGIRAGLEPLTNDPSEIAMRYVTSMDRHIALHEMINAAETAGQIRHFKDKRDVPTDWVPVGGMAGMDAYAPRDWARIWNNFIDKGVHANLDTSDAYNAFRNLSNLTTQTILSFSGYHAFAMSKEAVASDMVKGIGQIATGLKRAEVMRVLRGVADVAKAPIAPVVRYRAGKKFRDIYLGRTPNDMALLFAEAGGRAIGKEHAFDYTLSKYGSFATAWKRGWLKAEMRQAPDTFSGAFKEAYQKVKQAGGSDTMAIAAARKAYQTAKSVSEIVSRSMSTVMAPLFEKYIPMLKNGAFANEMASWMEMNPQASREQQVAFAAKLLDSIDNRFGEMIQDNIMWSTTAKQVATLGMLSYSWNLGSLRLFAGGAKDLADFSRGALDPTSEHYSPNAAWIIAYPMAVATVAAVIQYLKTGKPPRSPQDLITPLSGGTAPGFGQRGQVPQREITPGYEKEPFGWYYNGVNEAANKLNPFLRMGVQAIMNQDWKGDPIVPPDPTVPEWLQTMAKYWVSSIIPITLGQVFGADAPGGNITAPEKMLGIRQAPLYAQDPEGYKRGMSAIETEKWLKKLRYDWKHKLISDQEYAAEVRKAREKQLKYGGPQQ